MGRLGEGRVRQGESRVGGRAWGQAQEEVPRFKFVPSHTALSTSSW